MAYSSRIVWDDWIMESGLHSSICFPRQISRSFAYHWTIDNHQSGTTILGSHWENSETCEYWSWEVEISYTISEWLIGPELTHDIDGLMNLMRGLLVISKQETMVHTWRSSLMDYSQAFDIEVMIISYLSTSWCERWMRYSDILYTRAHSIIHAKYCLELMSLEFLAYYILNGLVILTSQGTHHLLEFFTMWSLKQCLMISWEYVSTFHYSSIVFIPWLEHLSCISTLEFIFSNEWQKMLIDHIIFNSFNNFQSRDWFLGWGDNISGYCLWYIME